MRREKNLFYYNSLSSQCKECIIFIVVLIRNYIFYIKQIKRDVLHPLQNAPLRCLKSSLPVDCEPVSQTNYNFCFYIHWEDFQYLAHAKFHCDPRLIILHLLKLAI